MHKFLKFVKIIQYYSMLFIRVLRHLPPRSQARELPGEPELRGEDLRLRPEPRGAHRPDAPRRAPRDPEGAGSGGDPRLK